MAGDLRKGEREREVFLLAYYAKNDEKERKREKKSRALKRERERVRDKGRKKRREQVAAVVSRVIAVGTNTFPFALLAAASGYLLYHYKCNEMLRDVTSSSSSSARAQHALLYNEGTTRLIATEIQTRRVCEESTVAHECVHTIAHTQFARVSRLARARARPRRKRLNVVLTWRAKDRRFSAGRLCCCKSCFKITVSSFSSPL